MHGEADVELRDGEIVPFLYDGGISAFMKNEVLPYAHDAWVDEESTKIGYELSFTKHFYKPTTFRSVQEIMAELQILENETDGMLNEIFGGLQE